MGKEGQMDDHSNKTVLWFLTPSALLSLIGSSWIIISFSVFKKYREKSPHHSIICCMAICDWVIALSWWIPFLVSETSLSEGLCYLQAFVMEFFGPASWIWPSIFAARLLFSNLFEWEYRKRWAVISHIVGWGVPLFLAILFGGIGYYGKAGLWCWIDNDHPAAQIFFGDGIVVIMFLIELTVFSLLVRSLRTTSSGFGQLQAERRHATLRMSLFLLVPPICWSWALADRFIEYVTGSQVYWLAVVHVVMATSQGFWNALLYGWDAEIMNLWLTLVFKESSRKEKHRRQLYSSSSSTSSVGNETQYFTPIPINVNNLYRESEQDGLLN